MRAFAALVLTLFVLASFPPAAAQAQSASYVGTEFTTGACSDTPSAACLPILLGTENIGLHVVDTVQGFLKAEAHNPNNPPGLEPVADAQGACIVVTLVGVQAPALHGCNVVVISPIPPGVVGLRVAFEPGPSPDGTCLCMGMAGNVLASTF